MQPIRVGVIGLGLIWIRTHKQILAAMPELFELVAFCDPDEQRRNQIAHEFPHAPVFDNHHDLLALPEVDAVLVLTPLALNAPIALAALQAGKHVIMEKPIARSVAEARNLIAVAKRTNRLLLVAEQSAYRQVETMLAELIASGAIGELILWERIVHSEGDTGPVGLRYEETLWRKQADFPLGPMFDGGIHLIASLSKAFGAPRMVAANGRKLRPEYGDYDQISVLLQYEDGSSGMVSFSNCLPRVNNQFFIYGTTGMIRVDEPHIRITKPEQAEQIIEAPAEHAHVQMWHALGRALQEQREPWYTPQKALGDVAILEAIDQAIKSREQVVVETA